MSLLGRLDRPIAWLAGRRLRQMEAAWRDPLLAQERRFSAWSDGPGYRVGPSARLPGGLQHRQLPAPVPITVYLDVRPLVERAIGGERDVLWPGRPTEYCKTSGTTAGDKYIPVTREAFRTHRQGWMDALLLAYRRVGGAATLDGPLLFLGGSTATAPLGCHAEVGDLSGLAARRLPAWIRHRYAPEQHSRDPDRGST